MVSDKDIYSDLWSTLLQGNDALLNIFSFHIPVLPNSEGDVFPVTVEVENQRTGETYEFQLSKKQESEC